MKLAPFPIQFVLSHPSLPFDVFNVQGHLLLAAGQPIDAQTRQQLSRWALYADATLSQAWRRELANRAVARQGGDEPEEFDEDELRQRARRLNLSQQWMLLVLALESALREPQPDGAWVREALAVRQRARRLAEALPDASTCHLVHVGGTTTHLYSCHQALRSMVVAGACARALGWSEAQVASLECAALTMNVALRPLQDMLAQRDAGLSAGLRWQVAQHPREAAKLLAAAGVADPVWLGAVLLHHDAAVGALPPAGLTPAQQAAQLLRRVDIFGAKLSRRGRRAPLSGLRAVRETCLGPDGQSDAIGAALLQAVGLYPPGSFVRLASGEAALVLARGSRVNAPRVGAFTGADGALLALPRLRDTAQPAFAVKAALDAAQVPERPDHEQLLALLR
ncbi:HD-GYP domain-containing protein [Azohydromonas aeria]|uniref:HD-GYP domain-containing protein n=1 Tax=Azohydromonas aeria TaxID=2590212 RepID=UPI0012F95D7A|nr:hypothetical protein [Azohydromonas aeria]